MSSSASRTVSTQSSNRTDDINSDRAKVVPELRSQYPADSTEKHVEYILVASFDIDKGSVMEHQYPNAISGNENMADATLPPQAKEPHVEDIGYLVDAPGSFKRWQSRPPIQVIL